MKLSRLPVLGRVFSGRHGRSTATALIAAAVVGSIAIVVDRAETSDRPETDSAPVSGRQAPTNPDAAKQAPGSDERRPDKTDAAAPPPAKTRPATRRPIDLPPVETKAAAAPNAKTPQPTEPDAPDTSAADAAAAEAGKVQKASPKAAEPETSKPASDPASADRPTAAEPETADPTAEAPRTVEPGEPKPTAPKSMAKAPAKTGGTTDQSKTAPAEADAAKAEPGATRRDTNDPATGNQRTGDQKTGDQKTGDQKTGDQKTGDQKTGDQKIADKKAAGPNSAEPETAEPKGPVAPAPFTEADTARVKQALRAIKAKDFATALTLRKAVSDRAARRLITWLMYNQGRAPATFTDIVRFRTDHADWPVYKTAEYTAERAITRRSDPAAVEAWFAVKPPQTQEGLQAAYTVLWRDGRKAAARSLVRRAWRDVYHAPGVERVIYARFKALLTEADHYARASDLLRRGKSAQARNLAKLTGLDDGHQAAITARMQMISKRTRGNKALILKSIGAVPKKLRDGPDFVYALVQWNSRLKRHDEVTRLLAGLKETPPYPKRWWEAREEAIRDAFSRQDWTEAYTLASTHAQRGTDGEAFAQFMAGFVALRLVDKPKEARRFLTRGLAVARGAWDISQHAYWLGRADEALGDMDAARRHWAVAAQFGHTIYGQLAARRLGREALTLTKPGNVPAGAAFWRDEMLRAAHLLVEIDEKRTAYQLALRVIERRADTAAEQAWMVRWMAGVYFRSHAKAQARVRISKFAQQQGYPLVYYGYPTIDLPATNVAEPALVYALIRQESEFDPRAKSWVGARGLMQLMHFTARYEARDQKMPYSLGRLTSDPAYNLRLGTAHMERLLNTFEGSYPLVLSAYNAGAGRAARWLQQHGDPRTHPKREWIDWIEMIPFTETRLYTKRVLEAVPIYRLQLGDTVEPAKLVSYWSAPKRNPRQDCLLIAARTAPEIDETINYGRLVTAMAAPDLPAKARPLPTPPEVVRGGRKKQAKLARHNPSGIALVARRPHDNIPGAPDCSAPGE